MKTLSFSKSRCWISTLYVLSFCSLGFYLYPSADDYVFRSLLRDQGFWQSQITLYTSWTGRWFNTFLVLTASQINPMLLLWITVAFNVVALYVLFSETNPKLPRGAKAGIALLSQAVWFSFVPALNETFYWLSGMPYIWTAAFSLLCCATLIHVLRSKTRGVLFYFLLLLVFLNGLILETMGLMQIVFLFWLTLRFMSHKDYFSLHTSGFVLLTAAASFLVLYLSPGTGARMGEGGQNVLQTLGVAGVFGGITSLKFFMKPMVYLVVLYMPVIAVHAKPFDEAISKRLRAGHIFALMIFIALFQQAIAGWAMSMGLPARAEGLVIWIMGATWLFLWSFGYRNEKVLEKIRSLRIYPWRNVLLVLCLLLNGNFISLLQDLRVAPLYAAEQQDREASIIRQKNEGKKDIVVSALTVKPRLLFFSDLRPFSSDWKNQSYAEYWGVRSIIALPAPLLKEGAFPEGKGVETLGIETLGIEMIKMEALAAAGDTEAQFMLGEIYDTTFASSKEVPKDNGTAAKWYRMAAEQGYSPAQRRLTRFYALGMGVPQNYLYAIGWLLRSQF
ncbi:MAG: sel1 repeat family protein [Synergistaceae bacterium]|nr:sel1 repeat family protein [Synergistaceae bacterium]